MSVKNDIRSELEAHRGEDISGQYLAEKLGVSRNAVWKAINSLKNDGYKITSSTNKGYCLSESCDILSQSTIERLCGENTDIKIFESLDSTNGKRENRQAVAHHFGGANSRSRQKRTQFLLAQGYRIIFFARHFS